MAHVRLLHDNLWALPTTAVGASSSAPALPAGASQNPDRKYVWRSLSQTGDHYLDIDLGSPRAVTAIAAADTVLPAGGSLKLQQRGSAGSPAAPVDVVTLPAQNALSRTTFAFFSSVSHRHWRLLFTNPGGVSYAEVGYVFLGTNWSPAQNVRVPMPLSRTAPSASRSSADGQKTFTRHTKFVQGGLEFSRVQDAELGSLQAIYDSVGIETPVFIVLDDTKAWTCWLARFTTPLKHDALPGAGFAVSLGFEEVR